MFQYYNAADKSGTVSVFIDIYFLLSWIRLEQKSVSKAAAAARPQGSNHPQTLTIVTILPWYPWVVDFKMP